MEVDDVIEYWTLNNGTRLIAEEIPHLRSVAIGIYIKTGSRDEVFPINGASHFIEHMLFKGTETRTAKDIAETFESIGGQLNAYTSKEYTCIYARTWMKTSNRLPIYFWTWCLIRHCETVISPLRRV